MEELGGGWVNHYGRGFGGLDDLRPRIAGSVCHTRCHLVAVRWVIYDDLSRSGGEYSSMPVLRHRHGKRL